jgi:hypothetical protein
MEKEHDYDSSEFAFEVQPRRQEKFKSDAEKEVFEKIDLKIGDIISFGSSSQRYQLEKVWVDSEKKVSPIRLDFICLTEPFDHLTNEGLNDLTRGNFQKE